MGVEIFRIKKLDSVLYKMICNFVYFFILKEILFGFVEFFFFLFMVCFLGSIEKVWKGFINMVGMDGNFCE